MALDWLKSLLGINPLVTPSSSDTEEVALLQAVRAAVDKAENNLKEWNTAIRYAKNKQLLHIHKPMEQGKGDYKVTVLSQLKKDLNNLLREF